MKSHNKLKKREKTLRRARAAADRSLEAIVTSAPGADRALERTASAVNPPAPEAAVGQSAPDAAEAFGRYNAILAEIARSNVAAMGDLFTALIDARSVPEAVAVQADHLRRQIEAAMAQGRDLVDLTQALALDALAPPAGPIEGDR